MNIYCSLQVSFATFGVYILTGNELTASKAFLAMSLFNIIRFPFTILPFAVISFVQVGFSYLKRETLSTPERVLEMIKKIESGKYLTVRFR